MSARFRSVDRSTAYLLPPSIDEWLPERHLARFVADVVSQLDTSSIESCYSGRGSDAWHPKMLISLLFYGYATGVFSSRKLERATHDSVAFRYLCASKHKALSMAYACKLEAQFESEVKELMRLAGEADATELPEGFSIPEELEIREKRLAAIRDTKTKIEERAAELKGGESDH